jgi:hypothetical protein
MIFRRIGFFWLPTGPTWTTSLQKHFKAAERDCSGKNRKPSCRLIQDPGVENISTIINKFHAALNQKTFVETSRNIFVLIDESHRTQYGMMHQRMKKILPNACYIGFTGTPLMKNEKNTAARFGGIIDSYSMDQAVKDRRWYPSSTKAGRPSWIRGGRNWTGSLTGIWRECRRIRFQIISGGIPPSTNCSPLNW